MKLKSLFLTSMVALALGACSNATEDVANTNNAEKSAFLNLSVDFNNATSRATTGEKAQGSTAESAVQQIQVNLDYDGTANDQTLIFTKDGSNKWTSGPTEQSDKSIQYSISKIPVFPGNVTINVKVNGSTVAFTNNVYNQATYANLDGLNESIAKPSDFVMAGTTTATLAANQETPITIPVDRLAAKIQETSTATKPLTVNVMDAKGTVTSTKLDVTFTKYSFMNLAKSTNLYYSSTFASSEYAFPLNLNQDQSESFPASFINMPAADNTFTYCLENNSSANKTYVVYEAMINNNQPFFVAKKSGTAYVFLTFDDLDAAFGHAFSVGNKLTAGSSVSDFYDAGVIKYVNGTMYYKHAITTSVAGADNTTSDVAEILRNNWYIMTIGKVNGLGTNVLDPNKDPEENTMLTMTIKVMPWTYQVNNFDL